MTNRADRMDNPTRGLLIILPNELITNILATLHYRDLASCTQVCRRMADIIRDTALLQYHLELGRCGMDDGPLSTLSIPERRERLQAYDDAWKSLRWSTCINLFDIPDRGYEMSISPGGILTFMSRGEGKIIFVQIPSDLRGIPIQQWELSFPFAPHACALDPSEDILVVLHWDECHLHFLSLSTGKPHPLVAVPLLCDPFFVFDHMALVRFNVAQNHVSVLIINRQLRVWNWKTGQILLDITSKNVRSVSFLPENRLLLATTRADDFAAEATPNELGKCPALVMYNLDQMPASQQRGAAASPIAVFALELGYDIIPINLTLHYQLNAHPYSHEAAVPFFSSPADHLIDLQATGMLPVTDDRRIIFSHVLLIPMARLTSHIGSTAAADTPTRYIPWINWGSIGVRRVPDPNSLGNVRNALSGSRFIPRPQTRELVDVWDFSRAGVALEPQRCDRETFPCVQKQLVLPSQIEGKVIAMISEDAIVICESRIAEKRIYLLVF